MSHLPRRPLHVLVLAAIFAAAAMLTLVTAGFAVGYGQPANAVAKPVVKRHVKRRPPKPTLGEQAATAALKAVGVPYRWGGTSRSGGFDCSGLVRWAYGRVGISVPHNSYALYRTGRAVRRSKLRPGDVLVFSGLGHVGLYVGRGRMVHAPYSGRTVEIVRLARSHYGQRIVGARRVTAA